MAIGNKAGARAEKPVLQRAGKFLRESRAELRKVHWPTRKEVTAYTIVVLFITVVVAAFVGLADVIFFRLLDLIGVLGR